MLEQDPALSVDDRLREPGRTGGEEDPERMVERQLSEVESRAAACRTEPVPAEDITRRVAGRQDDGVRQARERRSERGDHFAPVEVAPAVAISVGRQQDLRLDLGEAVDHGRRPELRSAGGPDRAQARAGEKGGDRLRDIREAGGDAISGLDAEGAKPRRHLGRKRAEVVPGELRRLAGLGRIDDRNLLRRLVAKHVLGVAQLCPWEPLRERHLAPPEHPRRRPGGTDIEELVDRLPECHDVIDRPLPQALVAGKREASRLREPPRVPRQRRARQLLLRRLPQSAPAHVSFHRASLARRRRRTLLLDKRIRAELDLLCEI